MNFKISENQILIKETISEFCKRELSHMMIWDESQSFPTELFKKLAGLGMMGVLVPQQDIKSGLGYFEYVTIISEISKVGGSIGLSVESVQLPCVGHILKFGSEEQKQKWLPKLCLEKAWVLGL